MDIQNELHEFDTLVEALHHCAAKGYTEQFEIKDGKAFGIKSKKTYEKEDVNVVAYARFEGYSSVSDMSIVYIIECNDGTKGSIINSYGTYADSDTNDFIQGI